MPKPKKEDKAAKKREKEESKKQNNLFAAKANIALIRVTSNSSNPFEDFLTFYKDAGDLQTQILNDKNCVNKLVDILICNTSTNEFGELIFAESLIKKLRDKLSGNQISLLKEIIEAPKVKEEIEEKLWGENKNLKESALTDFLEQLEHAKKSQGLASKAKSFVSKFASATNANRADKTPAPISASPLSSSETEKTIPEEKEARLKTVLELHRAQTEPTTQAPSNTTPIRPKSAPPAPTDLPPPLPGQKPQSPVIKRAPAMPTEPPPAPSVKNVASSTAIPTPPASPVSLTPKPLAPKIPAPISTTKPPVDHMSELQKALAIRKSKQPLPASPNLAPVFQLKEKEESLRPLESKVELRELIKESLNGMLTKNDFAWYCTAIEQIIRANYRDTTTSEENKNITNFSRQLSTLNDALINDNPTRDRFNAHVAPHLNKLIIDIFVHHKTTKELGETLVEYREGGSKFVALYTNDNVEKQRWNNILCAIAYAAAVVAGVAVGVAIGAAVVAATAATGGLALPFIGALTFGSAAVLGGATGFGLGNIVGGVAALIKNSVFKPVTAPEAVVNAMDEVDKTVADWAGAAYKDHVL